jgi:hypothetical protein
MIYHATFVKILRFVLTARRDNGQITGSDSIISGTSYGLLSRDQYKNVGRTEDIATRHQRFTPAVCHELTLAHKS